MATLPLLLQMHVGVGDDVAVPVSLTRIPRLRQASICSVLLLYEAAGDRSKPWLVSPQF